MLFPLCQLVGFNKYLSTERMKCVCLSIPLGAPRRIQGWDPTSWSGKGCWLKLTLPRPTFTGVILLSLLLELMILSFQGETIEFIRIYRLVPGRSPSLVWVSINTARAGSGAPKQVYSRWWRWWACKKAVWNESPFPTIDRKRKRYRGSCAWNKSGADLGKWLHVDV